MGITTVESKTIKGIVALITWLNEKWGNLSCPVCRNTNWKVQDQMFLTAESSSSINKNDNGIYIIPVSCCDCSYMMLLNKRILMEQMLSEDEK